MDEKSDELSFMEAVAIKMYGSDEPMEKLVRRVSLRISRQLAESRRRAIDALSPTEGAKT